MPVKFLNEFFRLFSRIYLKAKSTEQQLNSNVFYGFNFDNNPDNQKKIYDNILNLETKFEPITIDNLEIPVLFNSENFVVVNLLQIKKKSPDDSIFRDFYCKKESKENGEEYKIFLLLKVTLNDNINWLKIGGITYSNENRRNRLEFCSECRAKYLVYFLEFNNISFPCNKKNLVDDFFNRKDFIHHPIIENNQLFIKKSRHDIKGITTLIQKGSLGYTYRFKLVNQLTDDDDIKENINHYESVLGDNQTNVTNIYPVVNSPNNRIYIQRSNIQIKCYRNINNGDSFRIKGSKGMGKTELLKHLVNYAHNQQYLTISINFYSAPNEIFNDLRAFHNWVFNQIRVELSLNNEFATYDQNYDDNYDPNTNASSYLMRILNQIQNGRLLLALDNADKLFTSTIRDDVGGLWRSWCDNGIGNQQIRQKMMMIIAHATDNYPDYNINQSPFQGIPPITLLDWDQSQIREIAQTQYNLTITDADIQILMSLIGGHPRLIEIAMEYLHYENSNVNYLVNEIATTDESPFCDYLDEILRHLEELSALRDVYQRLINGYAQLQMISLNQLDKYHLQAMGLIRYENGIPIPKYKIYKEYFLNRLDGEII